MCFLFFTCWLRWVKIFYSNGVKDVETFRPFSKSRCQHSTLFEIALVLVRLDHVARFIINAHKWLA